MSDIQVMLGDCFTLMKDIPDHSVDLILTDPPYLFNRGHYDTTSGSLSYIRRPWRKMSELANSAQSV